MEQHFSEQGGGGCNVGAEKGWRPDKCGSSGWREVEAFKIEVD